VPYRSALLGRSLAAAQAGGHHGEQPRRARPGVLEMVRKVGVEGHAVARGKRVRPAVALQHDLARLD